MKKHFKEVLSSIKLLDIEETFDIYFSRFFGLFFAKGAAKLGLTAMHVTFVSLFVGIIGGAMLYFQDYTWIIAIACFLITLAGVLDSADGQLARLTGTSSDFGRMVDGTIDNFVFIACYLGASIYFVDSYGFLAINALGWSAGYAHSVKSSIYEFYKTEYLEFFNETKESCIPLNAKDLKLQGEKWYHKAVHYIILDYTSKQLLFTLRKPAQRLKMRELALDLKTKDKFKKEYRRLNKPMLTWWAIFCGTNTHRTMMMITALFGRFDLYLWISLVWTVALIPLSIDQAKRDSKLLATFSD